MKGQHVLVVGATGMIGGLILRRALAHPDVAAVTALGRRSVGVTHPGLREIHHQDFADLATVEPQLGGVDVAQYCLGAYTGSLPDAAFRTVTVDFTIAFARSLLRASPAAAFCFLSGQGADSQERSRIAFARYKGMAENALLSIGLARVHLFRPGYIYPVEPRTEPNLSYRVMRTLYPLARRLYPDIGLSSVDLADAMLHAGLHGTPGHESPILENRDIRASARALR